jgi:hypothetical protein
MATIAIMMPRTKKSAPTVAPMITAVDCPESPHTSGFSVGGKCNVKVKGSCDEEGEGGTMRNATDNVKRTVLGNTCEWERMILTEKGMDTRK